MTSDVHPWAAGGFARGAEAYERARPGYAPAAVAFLVQALELRPGATVVDLAAGTGKLARLFVPTGARVVAVEPLAEMRVLIPAGIEALDGVAEAIPLTDSSADAVTVAQAFHWFRADEALAEIHRVLRPGGGVAILRNERDLADPAQLAFAEILARCRAHPSLERELDVPAALVRSGFFDEPEQRAFPHVAELDPVALGASETSIALLDDGARAAALAEFAALGERVRLRYVTEVVVTRRAGTPPARPR